MKPTVVLVGRPNVGKSTLFNRLTRSRDALVHDLPGLTRDRHYGHGRVGDKPYLLVDTAGFEPIADGGILGGAFGLVFLIVLYRRGLRNLRRARTPVSRSLYAGSLVACTGLLLHEFVDFNLHIPANALIFVVIAVMSTSLIPEPIATSRHRSVPSHLPS